MVTYLYNEDVALSRYRVWDLSKHIGRVLTMGGVVSLIGSTSWCGFGTDALLYIHTM
jgi:hypothetical protein